MNLPTPLAGWLAVLVMAATVFASAEAVADSASKLESVREQTVELKKEISRSKNAQAEQERALERSDRMLAQLNSELAQLAAKEKANRREIVRLRGERKQILAQSEQQRNALAEQAQAAYLMGRQHQMKLLLNQEEPARVGRMLVYYTYFNRQRTELLKQLQDQLTKLKAIEQETAKQSDQIKLLQEQQQQRQEVVAKKREERAMVLSKLSAELSSAQAQLEKLEADEQRLTALTERLRKRPSTVSPKASASKTFQKSKGQLKWPVDGRISRSFGQVRGSTGQLRWRGVVIDAGEGSPVNAVNDGRVVFADWLRGYGFLVILDHGDGYRSLYGHNQRLLKAVGDRVKRGEGLAVVGDSGGYGKTALYFEIRHKGKPVNPKRWIAAAR